MGSLAREAGWRGLLVGTKVLACGALEGNGTTGTG